LPASCLFDRLRFVTTAQERLPAVAHGNLGLGNNGIASAGLRGWRCAVIA
jgi:hypothetical protein